jgi:hypothetical protein
MTPKESRYTFLAGVGVALFAAFLIEFNPHSVATAYWREFRPFLAAALLLFTLSTTFLYKAAAAASDAAQQRVDRNIDRVATDFDSDHHVDRFGYFGIGSLASAIIALVVDRWIHLTA